MSKTIFGQYLRERRLSLGLSMAEASQRLGYESTMSLSLWERGSEFPPKEDLNRIAEAYEIPADEWASILEVESNLK